MDLEQITVSPEQLLVDPNNPRYFDLREHQPVNSEWYAEEQIQIEAIAKLLQSYEVRNVRRSILANGFINFEYMVVKDYPYADDRYVVIEGNRRLAAIQGIRQDYLRGVLPPENQYIAETLESLQVLRFSGTEAEEKIIQGIRHVAGPKEWKSYQQASLITQLHEVSEMSFENIQDSLGLGPTVVRRLYNTLKAFEQMRSDDEFGESADRGLFSLFLEMLQRPALRGWLAWSDEELKFESSTNRKHMYRMIVGEPVDDEETPSPITINNPPEMRIFARILTHEHKDRVFDRLVEGDLSIAQAWAILQPDVTPWQEAVAHVVSVLEDLPADDLQSLSDSDEDQLNRLSEVIAKKLKQVELLKGS